MKRPFIIRVRALNFAHAPCDVCSLSCASSSVKVSFRASHSSAVCGYPQSANLARNSWYRIVCRGVYPAEKRSPGASFSGGSIENCISHRQNAAKSSPGVSGRSLVINIRSIPAATPRSTAGGRQLLKWMCRCAPLGIRRASRNTSVRAISGALERKWSPSRRGCTWAPKPVRGGAAT